MRIDLWGLVAMAVVFTVGLVIGTVFAPVDTIERWRLVCPDFGESRLTYSGDRELLDGNTRQFIEECDIVERSD